MLSWQIGDVRVTQIVELTTASLGPHLLPQATPEAMQSILGCSLSLMNKAASF